MSFGACLASRKVTTDIKNAYKFMTRHGVALVCSAIKVTKNMTDKMTWLSTMSKFVKGWEPIFNAIDRHGNSNNGNEKRQHLKYDDSWGKAFPGVKSPRKEWETEIGKTVSKFLDCILPDDFESHVSEHSLIRSLMKCTAQPWHYDQGFPGSERWQNVGDKNCPFVMVIGLEDCSFLDVEFADTPMRVFLAKGDVLLVRGDCLHRGTEFTFSEDCDKKQHLRGHVYIYPRSFSRDVGATYIDDKYPKFVPS